MQYELHGWHNSDYYNHAACMNKLTLQKRNRRGWLKGKDSVIGRLVGRYA